MRKIILCFISIILVTGCSFFNKEDVINSEINNNDNIIKEQVVGNFKISGVSLDYLNGTSTFNVSVTNTTEQELNITSFKAIFKTKNGNVIATLESDLRGKIGSNSTLEASMISDVDLSNAYSVEYDIASS